MNRRSLIRTFVILILVGVIFGAAIIFLMRFVDGPVTGTVSENSLAAAKSSTAPKPERPHQLAGLYVSLDYPAYFDQLAQIKTDATALEQYNLSPKNDYRQTITVRVSSLPGGDPYEDASYRIRHNDTATYRATPNPADKSVLMTKVDGSEQTLFVPYGGKLLTVSVTCSSTKTTAAAIMDVIKPSVRWIK